MLDIQQNVSLAHFTTFRVGGLARFFVAVRSEEELIEAFKYAKKNNLAHFVMGGGSNILFSDSGFPGLVIKVQEIGCQLMDTITIEAGAGVPLAKVVRYASEKSLAGMEWAAGIPGTLGGAVRGNAGAFGSSMNDVVESVRVLDLDSSSFIAREKLIIKNCLLPECQFSYRDSFFKRSKDLIILSAKIKLEEGISEEIIKKNKENIKNRMEKQPTGVGSAGSYFLNPMVENHAIIEEFEKDKGMVVRDGKVPAGWLIDQAGLRGKKIGGAMISEKHPNFLVNAGGATAEDVIILESLIKQQVRDKFGVELISEVEHAGFNN